MNDQAIDILINKLKFTNNHQECVDTVKVFYGMAYREGFEAGKKEGTVKIKEKIVYVDNNIDYGFQGGF